MKKVVLSMALVAMMSVSFVSCKDKAAEPAATEESTPAMEETTETPAETVDTAAEAGTDSPAAEAGTDSPAAATEEVKK